MAIILEQSIWLVLSNLFFILPAIYLFTVQLFVESFTYFNVTFWSSFYHLCYDCGICIIKDRSELQFMDFFSSYLCIGIIVVYFIDIYPRKYKIILQCLIAIIILFITCLDYFDTTVYVVVLSLFIPIGMIYFLIYMVKWLKDKNCFKNRCCCDNVAINFVLNNRTSPFSPIDILIWIIGISIFVTGFTLQIYVKNIYWVTHSIWHCLSAISALLIYNVYNKKNILMTICKLCKKDNTHNRIIITE